MKPFKAAKLSSIGLDPRQAQLKSSPTLSSIKGLVKGSSKQSSTASTPWFGSTGNSAATSLIPLESVDLDASTFRLELFSDEMNRVLGGGLMKGSIVLLAGDPGIGKSTLILQLASNIANSETATERSVVYISGEETPEQIAARAKRLGLSAKNIYLICDIDVDNAVDSILSMPSIPSLGTDRVRQS